jgi:hypothetical protein
MNRLSQRSRLCTRLAGAALLAPAFAVIGAPVGVLESAVAASSGPAASAPGATPNCVSGPVLFSDDFSNPASGWPVTSNGNGRTAYENGTFLVAASPSVQGGLFVTHPNQYGDFCAEVDAWLDPPTAGASPRLAFRVHGDTTDGYLFVVVPDTRQYSLMRQQGGQVSTIVGPTTSPAINPGGAVNRLGVQATGAQIVVSINGVAAPPVTDPTFQQGRLGLGAGHGAGGAADARFDNLEVRG